MTRSTYPQYLNRCGWNALLPARENIRPLDGDRHVSLAVIGAGYTGLGAARRWAELEPSDDIAIVDSSQLGEGNPGRNSGFLLEIALANDADPTQMARMSECNRLIGATMRKLCGLVADHEIDCELERAGTYRAAAGDAGRRALASYEQFLERAGLPWERLDRDQLESRLGTRFYAEGLYSPHCYLAQPAALIRGLADALPPSVTIYESTPALSIEPLQTGWRVRTPAGALACDRLVLANNAFTKQLGVGRSRLVAMYTYAGLTAPLPARVLGTLGRVENWGLLPAHRLGSTLRRTRDGRLLIRSHYGYERETDNGRIAARLADGLRRRYPQLQKVAFEHVWAGATGFTFNGSPIWGEHAPGLFVSSGCNGGGVVKGTLFGELLADLAAGRAVPDMRRLFGNASWMPPEPIRELGFRIISGLERRQGRAEM
ncbi:MAG: FAD-binding oxidoreductase [Gammaproteobacteria bacterium]|nr:FAD-binding oxidoreductase [Gammaproteobacteria bacterium]MDH4255912.1 FAD-binding oxidoreductase [Gammaproteobacteria bacterium]MDH5310966.1 FAD-binding oxidoreductase [Gammaproteobacteria bacterium]